MLDQLWGLFSSDLAIDLGTANTLVYTRGRNIIIDEPSVIAIKRNGYGPSKLLKVGQEAKVMLGKTTDSIKVITPLKDGVIADFEATEMMLRYFIQRAHNRATFVRPRIIICVPYGVTDVECRAVKDSAQSSGAREIFLVDEPMAAAIGAGLAVTEASGNMVVDIGGGTTEVAVIALGGIVYSKSVRVAGNTMDEAIINYVKRKYNLLIGEQTAEAIKTEVGTAVNDEPERTMMIKGQDMVRGIPKTMEITSSEINHALHDPLQAILDTVRFVLERTPPELSSDISERGIVLTGGGSLLHGIDRLISEHTTLPVRIAEDPSRCVVIGCGKILDNEKLLSQLAST